MFITRKRFNGVILDLVQANADLHRAHQLNEILKRKLSPTRLDDMLAAIMAIDVPKMRKAEIKRRLNEIIADYKQ